MKTSNRRALFVTAVLAFVLSAVSAFILAPALAVRTDGTRRPFVDAPNSKEIGALIDRMSDPALLDSSDAAMRGLSSNPYDYVRDNPEYRRIVALGADALPALEVALNDSQDSGLREYMICIAIEEITRCDLKQFGDSQWATASEFKSRWPRYLESVPGRVDKIVLNNAPIQEKRRQIEGLGLPAIPYVVERGGELPTADSRKMAATISAMLGEEGARVTVKEFGETHGCSLGKLRRYVEGP